MLAALPTALQIEGTEWLLLLSLFVAFVVLGIVGAFWVYGDARLRGMDAAAWAVSIVLAAFLLLGLGGLLIFGLYLAERKKHPAQPIPYFVAGPGGLNGPSFYACPVRQGPVQWIPEYGRWWCPRCGAYR